MGRRLRPRLCRQLAHVRAVGEQKFLVKFFSKNLRGVEQSSTALTGAAGGRSAAQAAHTPKAVAAEAVSVPPCLLFPQAKLRSLGQNNRGTYVPPFFVYGKAVASPPHPCKVLGFHPKPHKPFEKGLSENFTFLHLTQARGRYVPVGRCPAADRAGRRDKG